MLKRNPSQGSTAVGILVSLIALTAISSTIFFQQFRHPFDLMVGTHYGGRNDLTTSFFAYRSLPRWELARSGHLPFWNPYAQGGTPAYSNPEAGWLYPPNWLMLLFDGVPALSWLLVLHHIWGGLGTYLLCRRSCSVVASIFAGALFLGAPYWVAHTAEGHLSQACTVSWIPWVFLVFEHLRHGGRGGVLLMSTVMAITFFAGHVQELYYVVLMISGFVCAEAWRRYRAEGLAPAVSIACQWFLSCALMGGLIAVQFLPNWAHALMAGRTHGVAIELAGRGLTASHLWQLLYPFALGKPGVGTEAMSHYWETLCYFGVAPLVLVLVGVIWGKSRSMILEYAVGALLCFLFAFGTGNPLFSLMYEFVPGVSSFREASRVLFLVAFFVAVLAGQGVDRLLASRSGKGPSKLCWGFAFALMAISLIELGAHSNSLFGTVPKGNFRGSSAIVGRLQDALQHERVFAVQELLSDHEAWAAGIEKTMGYNPVPMAGYFQMFAAMTKDYDDPMGFKVFDPAGLNSRVFGLMNVKYILAHGRPSALPPGWHVVERGKIRHAVQLRGSEPRYVDYALIENPSVLPRAFVVGAAHIVEPGSDLTGALRSLEPREEVLLTADVLAPGPRASYSAATILAYQPDRVAIEASLDAPGYLVLCDAWCPGWTAVVDGTRAPILQANAAQRAVPLAAGQHSIVFRYRPALMNLGLMISGIALLVWGFLAFVAIRSRVGGVRSTSVKDELERVRSDEEVGTEFAKADI